MQQSAGNDKMQTVCVCMCVAGVTQLNSTESQKRLGGGHVESLLPYIYKAKNLSVMLYCSN